MKSLAIIGAGVSGLTTGVLLAEAGARVTIFADEAGAQTTSAAAGAIWFPYDVKPVERVLAWSLHSFDVLTGLTSDSSSGVSLIELRCFARAGTINVPPWALPLGARQLSKLPQEFSSGYAVSVPLIDTSIYLSHLSERLSGAGGKIVTGARFHDVDQAPQEFPLIINCAGVGARELAHDPEVEPHRGQIVLVARPELDHAIVCDDPPLLYIFPRSKDCVFGGTNTVSDDRQPSSHDRAAIMRECTRVLHTVPPPILGERVGLRPFRRTGVRLERESLGNSRAVVHNYGHGGAGFTLSWGCAAEVARLIEA